VHLSHATVTVFRTAVHRMVCALRVYRAAAGRAPQQQVAARS
jgi:hypothetical protein